MLIAPGEISRSKKFPIDCVVVVDALPTVPPASFITLTVAVMFIFAPKGLAHETNKGSVYPHSTFVISLKVSQLLNLLVKYEADGSRKIGA